MDISLNAEAKPRLSAGVRLMQHEAHGGWVLLAPERVFKADQVSVEILKRCNGQQTVTEIVDDLAAAYNAPRERISADVMKLIGDLAAKRLVQV
jgi:pyrroloquinoline quinone biosynthesis protein D